MTPIIREQFTLPIFTSDVTIGHVLTNRDLTAVMILTNFWRLICMPRWRC